MRNFLFASLAAVAAVVWVPAASAWTWPVDGPVLRAFALGDNVYSGGQHRGIDIGAEAGAPVRAVAGGQVTFAGTVPRYGKTLTIRTEDGYAVTLLHLGSLSTTRGATVAEGETVAGVGAVGDAQHPDPYVYLGIRHWADEQGYVDPLLFLPPASSQAPEPAQAPPGVVAQAPGAAASQASPPVAAQPPVAEATPAPSPLPSGDAPQPPTAPEAGGPAETRAAADPHGDVAVAPAHTRRRPDQTSVVGTADRRRELPNAPSSLHGQISEPTMRASASVAVGETHERSPSATILETAAPPRVVGWQSLAASRPAVKAAASTRRHRMVARPAEARVQPERPAENGRHSRRHRELWLLGLLAAALVGGVARRQRQSPATQPWPSQRQAPCPLGRRMPRPAVCGMTKAALRASHRCGRPVQVPARSAWVHRRRRRAAAFRTS